MADPSPVTGDAGVRIVPLDRGLIERRLVGEDFVLERSLDGRTVRLRVGPEFPGDALDLYPALLEQAGPTGTVRGTYVVVAPGGEVVGQVGTIGEPVAGEVEIGYGINASQRGRGHATRAVALLLDALFADGRVVRVRATCDPQNTASIGVLVRNGFTQARREPGDGLLRWTRALG